ncbi:MAG: DUF58 domain-containing protein [Planctomycetes bacterium]|nr:DUF58 domain-containing protein [Planctomycetota bacterium]MCB9912480.1 DUF58 domain-containing protein [Planctomycetota bacterium]
MAQHQGVIDPAVLDRLDNLALVARKVVEGYMAGHHTSPHRGSSIEFAQHRAYAPGDELRRVDWKVYARTERLVVKEYIEETSLSLNLLVDASESMAFASGTRSKLDYARWCAAALAHLVIGQRDQAGLVVFDSEQRTKVPPANGAPQEAAIMKALAGVEPKGQTALGEVLQWFAGRLRRRGITAIFSDFFEDPESILAGVKRLVHGGHEPILFQILDPQELEFPFDGMLKLDGLEAAGIRKVDARALRQAYLEEIENHNRALARAARALSVDFVSMRTDEPLDAVLSTYLASRHSRVRGGRSS